MFSAGQLVEQNKMIENFVLVPRGNKLTALNDEETSLSKLYECISNMKDLLTLERVLTGSKIARGTFERDKKRVKLLSLSGKFDMGYFEDNLNYLHLHEALHLMEMGRLEVIFDNAPMSIEQAFAVFVDQDSEVSFESYMVFSHLCRIGYHVDLHESARNWRNTSMCADRSFEDSEEKMIWKVLMESLKQPAPETFTIEEKTLYERTKLSMNQLNEAIAGKRDDDGSGPSSKRRRLDKKTNPTFLDSLKTEANVMTYQEFLKKFSFIRRTTELPESTEKLTFTFDVFIPKPNIKKTERVPSYRVVLFKSTDTFPSNAELELLTRRQKNPVPVVIAMVSESMTTHYSICTF